MVIADLLVRLARSSMARIVVVFALICSTMLLSIRPAGAAYQWCSVDPVLTFQREGSLSSRTVDVQVMVPFEALPLADAATLNVAVPVDVDGQEVLNTSTPLFRLNTVIEAINPQATSDRYPIELELLVPRALEQFPVRLVVTDPEVGTVTTVDGKAGQKVRTTVEVAP